MSAPEIRDAATGRLLDLSRQRFGFRETWIQDAEILLNGIRIKPKALTTPGPIVMSAPTIAAVIPGIRYRSDLRIRCHRTLLELTMRKFPGAEEADRADDAAGGVRGVVQHRCVAQALHPLVSLLLDQLTKQEPGQDEDAGAWNLAMAAGLKNMLLMSEPPALTPA